MSPIEDTMWMFRAFCREVPRGEGWIFDNAFDLVADLPDRPEPTLAEQFRAGLDAREWSILCLSLAGLARVGGTADVRAIVCLLTDIAVQPDAHGARTGPCKRVTLHGVPTSESDGEWQGVRERAIGALHAIAKRGSVEASNALAAIGEPTVDSATSKRGCLWWFGWT